MTRSDRIALVGRRARAGVMLAKFCGHVSDFAALLPEKHRTRVDGALAHVYDALSLLNDSIANEMRDLGITKPTPRPFAN